MARTRVILMSLVGLLAFVGSAALQGSQPEQADAATARTDGTVSLYSGTALDGAQSLASASPSLSYSSNVAPPPTIRVARRQKCRLTGGKKTVYGFNSCPTSPGYYYPDACGKVTRVDTVSFDYYTKHVLPREWMSSWHSDSLKSGAMAVKSYAWYWVNRGGKYPNAKDICGQATVDLKGAPVYADMDDTVNSQVYISEVAVPTSTSAAVDSVSQYRMTKAGKIFQASYRASTCDWKPDGYKLSQNGSNCWAKLGKPWDWILRYYYLGVEVNGASRVDIDDRDAGFSRTNSSSTRWYSKSSGGYESNYFVSDNTQTDPMRVGKWTSNLSCKGTWKVSAWIPLANSTTTKAKYTITRGGATNDVVISQAANRGKWALLGQYHFPDTPAASVELPSNTGETLNTAQIAYDDIRFDRVNCATDAQLTASPARVNVGWAGHDGSNLTATVRSGSLPLASRTVNFYQKPYGSKSWTFITAVKTSSWGRAVITVRPTRHTTYAANVLASPPYVRRWSETVVLARMSASSKLASTSINKGAGASFSGKVVPAHPYQTVNLQWYYSGSWKIIKLGKLNKYSAYNFGWVPRYRGKYPLRVCVYSHWDHQWTCTATRYLTVK